MDFNIVSKGSDEWGNFTIIGDVTVVSIAEEVRSNTNNTEYRRATITAGGKRFNGVIFEKMVKDFEVGSTDNLFRVRASVDNGQPVLTFTGTYGESNNRNEQVVASAFEALGLELPTDVVAEAAA